MEQLGQADGPESMDDLADFLDNNPEADASDAVDDEGLQNSDEPEQDNSEETEEDGPASDEEEDPDAPKEQTSLKFKVPVKGDDGTETTLEVDEKELVAGYQRHADYTRKTQELANKEREITQVVGQKFEENRSYYMQQAQLAQAAVRQLAGLRSPEEMAQLAQTDPATWVQEQQRERVIEGVLSDLQHGIQRESAQAEQMRQQAKQQEYQKAWEVLSKEGIDKSALQKIFSTVQTKYDIPVERFQQLSDPKLVMLMRDAAAYQDLKDRKAQVTKKVQDAPKLPAARQSVPRNEQQERKLNGRFASGKAKLNDLAAYLSRN